MRQFLFVLAGLFFLSASAHAAYSRNELPMYGSTPPSAEEAAADAKYIESAVAMKGSREAASDASMQLGFDYLLKRNDPATAMKRFNQGYLLDPGNGSNYQGMAITLLIRDRDAAGAEALFKRAIAAPKVTAPIYSDYARFLLQSKRAAEAIPLLERADALEPNNPDIGSLRAMAFYESGRIAEACPFAKRWQPTAPPGLSQSLLEITGNPACK